MSVTIAVIFAILIVLIVLYNTLVGKKNQVENIFASVDAQLKKRYDLIPNLVASVQEYMQHEKSVLENITQLRAQATKPDISESQKIALDAQVTSALGSIMVAVEDYPELKANENVMNLQASLNEVEAQIAASRRAYNQAVTDYNNAIEMIPTNFMAMAMNYKRKDVFSIDESQRENIDVQALFDR